jgi:hypothetical protein
MIDANPIATWPDPFDGLAIDIPDAIRDRLRKRLGPGLVLDRETTAPSPQEYVQRRAALPGYRRTLALRSVCRAVRLVVGEMVFLVAGRAASDSDRRFAVAHIQHIAMYVCHVGLQMTMTDIGSAFGRDRTTVGYACARVEDRRDDRAYDELVSAIERVVAVLFRPSTTTARH